MLRKLTFLWLGMLLALTAPRATAFSLLGPFDTWQAQIIGYQIGADVGGPMNLGEEYRLNLPMLTYGFVESFLNYFGSRGVEEVGKAMKMLDDLPAFYGGNRQTLGGSIRGEDAAVLR